MAVQGDLPGFARLGLGNQQCPPSPVDLFPSGMGDLVSPRPGQQEKQDSLSGEPGLVFRDGHQKPLGLLLGEEAVPVGFRGQLQGRCGVLDDADELPFPGEVEDVPQQDNDAVGGARRVALEAHPANQLGDALRGDLVEVERPQPRKDMQPEDRLVGLPAPLVLLDVGEVPGMDQFGERKGRPQFPALPLGVRSQEGVGLDRSATWQTVCTRLLMLTFVNLQATFEERAHARPTEGPSTIVLEMVTKQGEYFPPDPGAFGQLAERLKTEAKKVLDGAVGGAAVI